MPIITQYDFYQEILEFQKSIAVNQSKPEEKKLESTKKSKKTNCVASSRSLKKDVKLPNLKPFQCVVDHTRPKQSFIGATKDKKTRKKDKKKEKNKDKKVTWEDEDDYLWNCCTKSYRITSNDDGSRFVVIEKHKGP